PGDDDGSVADRRAKEASRLADLDGEAHVRPARPAKDALLLETIEIRVAVGGKRDTGLVRARPRHACPHGRRARARRSDGARRGFLPSSVTAFLPHGARHRIPHGGPATARSRSTANRVPGAAIGGARPRTPRDRDLTGGPGACS